VTLVTQSWLRLLALVLAFSAILHPRATLVVLGAGGQAATELEVVFIEHPVAWLSGTVPGTRPKRQDHVSHHGGGLPLARRDAGIEVRGSRFQERLTHVGSNPASTLNSDPVCFAHSGMPFHEYSEFERLTRRARGLPPNH
jgi:hypothetical protein